MKDSNATILGYCTSWCASACTALTRYSVFTHQRSISICHKRVIQLHHPWTNKQANKQTLNSRLNPRDNERFKCYNFRLLHKLMCECMYCRGWLATVCLPIRGQFQGRKKVMILFFFLGLTTFWQLARTVSI